MFKYTRPRGKCHILLERILKTPPTPASGHCLRFQHFAKSFPTCFYHLRHLVIHSLSIQMHVMCDHLAPHSSCLTRCHCRWQLRRETTGSCSLTSRRIRRSRCLEMDHFNVPRFISCWFKLYSLEDMNIYIYSNLYRNNRMVDLYTFEHGLFFFVRCVSGDVTLKHVEHSM